MVLAPNSPNSQLSDAIQPIGGLIAFESEEDRITHWTTSVGYTLGRSDCDLLNAQIDSVLPIALQHDIRNVRSLRYFGTVSYTHLTLPTILLV